MNDFAAAGSQRWLQIAIDQHQAIIDDMLQAALGLPSEDKILWISPVRSTKFREYRDMEALRQLGVESLPVRALNTFWPRRGPVWDGLARTKSGKLIFIEAKANIPEAASPPTRATPDSRKLILQSLTEARHFFSPRATCEWAGTFYQYANRLSHHYLFRELNKLPSHLVFLYFINAEDVSGPTSETEWRGAVRLLHAALGLSSNRLPEGVHEVFLDVRLLL